jgi:hypothetical protein
MDAAPAVPVPRRPAPPIPEPKVHPEVPESADSSSDMDLEEDEESSQEGGEKPQAPPEKEDSLPELVAPPPEGVDAHAEEEEEEVSEGDVSRDFNRPPTPPQKDAGVAPAAAAEDEAENTTWKDFGLDCLEALLDGLAGLYVPIYTFRGAVVILVLTLFVFQVWSPPEPPRAPAAPSQCIDDRRTPHWNCSFLASVIQQKVVPSLAWDDILADDGSPDAWISARAFHTNLCYVCHIQALPSITGRPSRQAACYCNPELSRVPGTEEPRWLLHSTNNPVVTLGPRNFVRVTTSICSMQANEGEQLACISEAQKTVFGAMGARQTKGGRDEV